MKRKIAVLGLITVMTLTVVGCSSQRNKEMKDTMNGVSKQLNNIDNSNKEEVKLTYEQAQELMEKINSQLTEFKPQLTPDKQTIILNLATREVNNQLEKEYIVINMNAEKNNYKIEVKGNIFKDRGELVAKNDASVRALYDLLNATKSIDNMKVSEFIKLINSDNTDKLQLTNSLDAFDNISFDYTYDGINFMLDKTYKRDAINHPEVKYTYEKYKKQREDLKNELTQYSKEFAKTNNLQPVVYEENTNNTDLTSFGVEGDNDFSTYIVVNTKIPKVNTKQAQNICEFNMPTNIEDAKAKQISKDYLVGAIRIINSITKSDINYGDIENVEKSNKIREDYLKQDKTQTIFEISNNLEKSLINNEYDYIQKVNIV